MVPPVFRRSDRARFGITEGRLVAQLAAERWQQPTPTVVVTHNGPLTPDQARLCAVLTASSAHVVAALAAWTALQTHGLVGWTKPQVHLLVPRGRTHVGYGALGVVVHESRRFVPADVRRADSLPRTSVERAAIDAAAWSTTLRSGCGVLAAVVQQRLASPARLLAELVRAGSVRHRRALQAALVDMAGGAGAVSELDFLRFCRRHNFPRPELQQVRRDAAGRRRFLDASFRSSSGREVHVEIDGAVHLVVASYWADMRRGNDLALTGTHALRFPSVAIHADDPDMLRQLGAALAA